MADQSTRCGRVIAITGAMAAGKSTVAELLAERLPRSVHVRGESFGRMIVNGREPLDLQPSDEALAQLHLRFDLAAEVADRFAAHGFDAIVQDTFIGPELRAFVDRLRAPERYLVVLSPSVSALEWREEQRAKTAYVRFSPAAMDRTLRRESDRLGMWLDSSAQSPEETVDAILANLQAARV